MNDRLDRSSYLLEFEERFDAGALDVQRWIPHYLPHWTAPERSRARYDLTPNGLRLRIDADQPAWRQADGELRVSNLQTGSFSGPLGSSRGQHRHVPGLTVSNPQPTRRLYTPSRGLVEARMRATADPTTLLAFWLIGFEEASPAESGEICVVELFGDSIGTQESVVSVGVKSHSDPSLRDGMARIRLKLDATTWHNYAATWDEHNVRFYVDDQLIHSVAEGISYPLQLMVDLFEFPASGTRPASDYPKIGEVQAVRGYRPLGTLPMPSTGPQADRQ